MRILMLNHNLEGHGTWFRAWQLARQFARRGHAVTLWTAAPHHYYRPVAEEREGVTLVQTPSWAPLAGADDGWGPLDILFRAARVLWEDFDLCYAFAHPPNVFVPAWLGLRLRRRPLLYDWCDWYEGGIIPKRAEARRAGLAGGERPFQERAERCEIALERRMARLAGRVTVISRRLEELALAAGRRPEEVLLLPNGADTENIRPLDPAPCRAALGLPEGGPLLGYVANYHPDQELLLRALARAVGAVPGLKLVKTGPPFAERLVGELGLGEAIIDLGRVRAEQIPLVLGAADAMALPLEDNPSNVARVPLKLTDYLAAGRATVTGRVGDVTELFTRPGEPIGLAVEPTPEAFGAAMAALFTDPTLDRAAMGRAARALAEREFSWGVMADKVLAFVAAWRGPAKPN